LIQGNVEWYDGKRVDEYYGIPFAKPPVGELRFMKPEPVEPWEDVWDASRKQPLCAQQEDFEGYTFSEDCLYVDVYTPSLDYKNDAKAVMVWIHGGTFVHDWHPDWYSGRALSPTGDVILVVLNYRLGALGFLSTGDDVIAGNQAAFDQNLALQWVQKNIGYFGGDPGRVTLFGQSSGAIMTKHHSLSPLSGAGDDRLFQNIIIESGQNLAYNDDPLSTAEKFAGNVGCKAEFNTSHEKFLACVQKAPLIDILRASDAESNVSFMWSPRVDNKFLLHAPTKEYLSTPGLIDRFNIMVGCTTGEIAMGASTIRNKQSFELIMKPLLRILLPVDVENAEFWYDLERIYLPSGNPETLDTDEWRTAYIALGMDTGYTVYLYDYAEAAATLGANLSAYNFQHTPSIGLQDSPRVPGDWNEPWHGDDLMFVFGRPLLQKIGTQREQRFSTEIMQIWGSFANYGYPNVPEITGEWPPFSPTGASMLLKGHSDFELDPEWRVNIVQYWRDYLLPTYPAKIQN